MVRDAKPIVDRRMGVISLGTLVSAASPTLIVSLDGEPFLSANPRIASNV